MKYLSSFPFAHAVVLALILGVFLVDGCMSRTDRHDAQRAPADAAAAASQRPLHDAR
jgi:hypothetical protein